MRAVRPSLRVIAAALLPLVLATCTEDNLGPVGRPGLAQLPLQIQAPNVSQFAGLSITDVRATVTKLNPATDHLDVLLTKTAAFAADANTLQLSLSLVLTQPEDTVGVTLEYLSGSLVVFTGTQQVIVRQGPPGSNPDVSIPVTYAGPGANIGTLDVEPKDSVVTAGGTLPMRVSAVDSQDASVPAFYVSWSSTSAGNVIDANGVLHAGTARATFYVRAVTPTGIKDSSRVTVIPAPATITKVSGDGQTGPVSSALPLPLIVEVRGADNLPIRGVAVAFAVATGGGQVDTATVVTASNGRAGTTVKLGPTAPSQSFTATVAGIAPVTFTATATPIGPATYTWTGATSTDWFTAGNWSPATVPGAADNAIIPNTATKPTIGATTTITNLTVNTGATVTVGSGFQLTLSGTLSLSGTLTCTNCNVTVLGAITTLAGSTLSPSVLVVGSTMTVAGVYNVGNNTLFQGTNQLIPANLTYSNLSVTGTASLTGRTNTNVSTVVYAAGRLTLAGHTLVTGLFQVGQAAGETAQLVMTNALDSIITTNAVFQGGSELGALTAGVLSLGGNFTQSALNSTSAFAATGTHKTVFTGTVPQTLAMPSAGAAQSRFNILDLSAATSVSLVNNAYVAGQLVVLPSLGGTPVLRGTTGALTAAGVNVRRLIIDTIPIIIGGGTVTLFDSVTFLHTGPAATALTVNDAGAAVPYAFDALNFGVVPTTGLYLRANDTDGATPNPLTVNLTNATPATPGAFIQAAGGAVINWPPAAPSFTWIGATSNWTTASNWSTGSVPGPFDQVVISPATVEPTITATTLVGDIQVATGATLTLNAADLQVNGSLSALGALTGVNGGTVILAGNAKSVGGTINAPVRVTESYLVTPALTVSGGNTLNVTSGGILTLSGHAVTTTNLLVNGNGIVAMSNPLDSMKVVNNATFDGSGNPGVLSAGVLLVGDSLVQPGGTPASFAPVGTFKTVMNGPAGGVISFGSPITSFFQDLDIAPTGGTVRLATAALVNGTFQRLNTAGTFAIDSLVLIINGDAIAPGTITATTGGFTLSGLLHNVQGNFPGIVSVQGNRMLTGSTTTGILDVSAGILTVNGQRLTAATLLTTGTGTIGMTNPLDTVVVSGNAGFQGGDETGLLTNGAIRLSGDFAQGPTAYPASFAPSGSMAVLMVGAAGQQIHFANPGPAASHFQNVVIANASAAGVTLDTVYVLGNPAFAPGLPQAQRVIHGFGPGSRLVLSNLNVTQTTFDKLVVRTPSDGSGVITKFDSVTFSNTAVTDTALWITQPGAAAPYTFSDVIFQVTPTTGEYILADDADDAPPFLTINMLAATPANGSPFFLQRNGAVIQWPAAAPTFTWTGGAGTSDWNTPTNWSTGSVPAASDSVVIVASTTTPVLTGPVSVGAVDVSSGTITLNSQTLAVARTLATTGTGTLTMTNPGDILTVSGNASFAGGSTAGLLTAGTFQLAGNLTQAGNALSFSPAGTGTLLLSLFGSTAHTVTFSTSAPDATQPDLRDVVISGSGTVDFNDGVRIHGALTVNSPVIVSCGVAPTFCQVDSAVTTVAGSALNMGALGLGGAVFNVAGSYSVTTTEFVGPPGQLIPATVPYQDIRIFTTAVTAAPLNISGELRLSIALGTPGLTLGGSFTAGADILINGGDLNLNGNGLTTPGGLTVQGAGTITMTNPLDQLGVGTTALFDGGDETGKLTAGTLTVGGNFTQQHTTSPASFVAGPGHTTVLNGSALQAVAFADTAVSGFGNLTLSGAGGVTVSGLPLVNGSLTVQSGTVTASDQSITGSGFYVVGNITSAAGTGLTLGRLYSGSTLTVGGAYTVTLTGFIVGSANIPLGLPYQNIDYDGGGPATTGPLNLSGSLKVTRGRTISNGIMTLGGHVNVGGSVVIDAPNSLLDFNGQSMHVAGDFTVQNGAAVNLVNGNDSLIVVGNALFDGGDETGKMGSLANLVVGGNLTQANSTSHTSFVGDPNFITTLNGTTPQTLTFADSLSSYLGRLVFFNPSTLNVASVVGVAGDLSSAFGGASIIATDVTLNGTGFNVSGNVTTPNPTTLTLGRLYIGGQLQAGLPYNVTSTIFTGTGQLIPSGLPYQSLYVTGTATFTSGTPIIGTQMIIASGSLTLAGNTSVNGPVTVSGGTLVLNGHGLGVENTFQTTGSGTVTMTSAADSLDVLGPASFDGGSEAGLLTAGTLYLHNDFTQLGDQSPQSYRSTGAHATRFVGTSQAISFQNPGAANSAFNDLWFTAATGPISFGSDVFVQGTVQWGGFKTYSGNGHLLTLSSLNVGNGALFDNLRVDVESGGPMSTTAVQFQNYAPTDDVLTINGPGTSATNNISAQFLSPITTGHYVVANKNGGLANLTVNIFAQGTPSIAVGQAGSVGLNGATVVWQ